MASVNAARSTAAAADAGTAYDIAALIRGYRDRVRADMARQIRSDADTLDDLEQETWIRVYASLHRFTGQSLVGTWVIGVARHVAADERRRRRRFERARAAFARERGAMVAAQ
jgi:RNA polymerase sigma-70 factor (ECF subfamily)